jgi:hypothetical protein
LALVLQCQFHSHISPPISPIHIHIHGFVRPYAGLSPLYPYPVLSPSCPLPAGQRLSLIHPRLLRIIHKWQCSTESTAITVVALRCTETTQVPCRNLLPHACLATDTHLCYSPPCPFLSLLDQILLLVVITVQGESANYFAHLPSNAPLRLTRAIFMPSFAAQA